MTSIYELPRERVLRLAQRVVRLQELRPQGFRSPRRKAGGALTLSEQLALLTGAATFDDLQPAPSARGVRKRKLRRFTRMVVRAEREKGRPLFEKERSELYAAVFPPEAKS